MTALQYPQYTPVASPAGPVLALPWHGTPQANLASTTTLQNQIQYHNPNLNSNPSSDSAHLLLARATYVNNKDQAKDVYSASQHFANDVLGLKHYS
jgi:hypothetical protein